MSRELEPLPREFFERDALSLARALLGTRLVVQSPNEGGVRVGRIVETEAYRGASDRACHASRGVTPRTRSLFGPAGHAYVYLIYGMYELFNVVAKGAAPGHAVLVRAVEPLQPLLLDSRTSGPGLLTRALGITRAHDGVDLCCGDRVWIAARDRRPKVVVTARVGVAYAGDWATKPYRFFDEASAHVSSPPRKNIGLG